jgi:hypothetical protein
MSEPILITKEVTFFGHRVDYGAILMAINDNDNKSAIESLNKGYSGQSFDPDEWAVDCIEENDVNGGFMITVRLKKMADHVDAQTLSVGDESFDYDKMVQLIELMESLDHELVSFKDLGDGWAKDTLQELINVAKAGSGQS